MNRAVKWLVIIVVGLVVLVLGALIIIPNFYDLNHFKPQIEKQVAAATGRPFTLGGEISLSLFPWAGVALEDVHLGNPSGFSEKDFISVKSFEVRVKLLPLLSKNLEVQRFVVDTPRIVLAKNKKGQASWEGLAGQAAKTPSEPKAAQAPSDGEFPLQSLAVGEFEIKNGSLIYLDEKAGTKNEISALNMRLKDVSFDRPILVDVSAKMDGKPLAMKGQIGPVGKEIGKKPIALDMEVAAFEEIKLKLKGVLENVTQQPQFNMALNLESFSPRKLMAALGQEFPVQTSDPGVLSRVSVTAGIKGTPQAISISDGVVVLDDSTIKFSLQAKEFDKPNLGFNLNLDRIDADRYLPPQTKGAAAKEGEKPTSKKATSGKTDYAPLRKPVLNGTLKIGELKINGAKVQDISAKVAARNGLYTIDPMSLKLYSGSAAGNAVLDVQGNEPQTSVNLQAKQIQAGPLLVDLMQKDTLEGTLDADVALSMAGDDPARIKPTLNGKGALVFSDGAIKGIDLAGMARNAQAAFGLAEKGGPKPRTDFSELNVPFTINNGVFNTPNANLASPFLRLKAAGTADLVKEKLDFRVEPKVVGTLKGQGDTDERSGLTVPILVSGSFSNPSFKPDLEGMAKKKLQEALTDPDKFKESIKEPKKALKSLEEQGKGLLKGLPFGK
jgi:AsmA protein